MNKKLMITLLCLSIVSGLSATNKKNGIIKDASYVVFDGTSDSAWGYYYPPAYAKFYTYDGKLINIINDCKGSWDYAQKKQDPKAPKPRPTKFKIIYDRGYPFVRSGAYWIVFYDIHGNRIYNTRYFGSKNPTKNYIASLTKRVYKDIHKSFHDFVIKRLDEILDLSIVSQEIEKPWYKFSK